MLTPRDHSLLRALNRFRIARSSDLRRLLFADRSPARAAERLRQLFCAGYLEVRVDRLSEENIYALGPAGKRWIESVGAAVRRLPAGGIAHHLSIVSAWTQLASVLRADEQLLMRRFRPDWEIRELQRELRLSVVPDALVELESGQRMVRLALEVDLATERHAVLRRKFEAYGQLRWQARECWGWTDLRLAVLVWSGGPRRVASLQRLLGRIAGTDAALVPRESWPAAIHSLASAPPLTAPTNSKQGLDAGTGEVATVSSSIEAGHSRKRLAGSVGS